MSDSKNPYMYSDDPYPDYAAVLDRNTTLEAALAACRKNYCRGDDPTCPCHDGDHCHYRGEKPMLTPAEREIERLRGLLSNAWTFVEPTEGQLMVYVGVHVVNWRPEYGKPTAGFIQTDAIKE